MQNADRQCERLARHMINQLRDEAFIAGDMKTVKVCDQALCADVCHRHSARVEVAEIINNARAMCPSGYKVEVIP